MSLKTRGALIFQDAGGEGGRITYSRANSRFEFTIGGVAVGNFSASGQTFNDPVTLQTAHSGLLLGAGASGANHELGATADNGLEFYLNGTHTTGDMRGMYLRLYFSGAGGSGEAARIFATVNNVSVATGGTVNGAHVTLSVSGASGAVSGAGNALRATLGLGAATNAGGTLAALQIDSDFATDATLNAAMCAIRLTNSGVGLWANLIQIPAASNGTIFAAHTTQTMTHSIRIRNAAGTAYYVMVTDAATNRS